MHSTACGDYNASIGTLNLLGIPAYDLYITELVAGDSDLSLLTRLDTRCDSKTRSR
jgi:hypothetical protein